MSFVMGAHQNLKYSATSWPKLNPKETANPFGRSAAPRMIIEERKKGAEKVPEMKHCSLQASCIKSGLYEI